MSATDIDKESKPAKVIGDLRRKLEPSDYGRIRYYLWTGNFTVRDVSQIYQISTKHAKKIELGHFVFNTDGTTKFEMGVTSEPFDPLPYIPKRFLCSGCGMSLGSSSGLSRHYSLWTSGGTHPLTCSEVMPPVTVTTG